MTGTKGDEIDAEGVNVPSAEPSSLSLSCSISSSLDMPDMNSSSESIGLPVVSGVGGPSLTAAAEAILLLDLWAERVSEATIASAAFRFFD